MAARTGVRRVIRPLVVVPTVVLLAVGAGGAALALRSDDDGTTEAVTTTEQVVEVGVEDPQQTIASEGTIEAEATEDLSFTASAP